MKYLDLINSFWAQDATNQFSPLETKLYFALLNIANQLRWQEKELSIPNGKLMGILDCSKNTLSTTRNGLVEKGLIKIRHGDRRKTAPKYTISQCGFGSISDPKTKENESFGSDIGSISDPKNRSKKEFLGQVLGQNESPYIREDKRSKRREDNTSTRTKSLGVENDPKNDPIPYAEIAKLFNAICPSLKTVRGITESRKKHIRARWKEMDSLEKWKGFFSAVESSKFLTGNNDRGWMASFDWLLNEQNMTKVLEGRYEDRKKKEGELTQFDLVRGPVWEKQTEVELDDFAILEEVLREDGEPERE